MPHADQPDLKGRVLVLRADGRASMGYGHLMRCLALGQGWKGAGGTVWFVSDCESAAARRRLRKAGFRLLAPPAPCPDPADLGALLELLQQAVGAPVVVDGYHFTPDYCAALRSAGHPVLLLDDNAERAAYPATWILNQNLHAPQLDYQNAGDAARLLGPTYALLRQDFLASGRRRRPTPPTARRLLVTLGGSDPDDLSRRLIEQLAAAPAGLFETRLVVGPGNPRLRGYQQLLRRSGQRVRLLRAPENMARQMVWADLCISAAGSTAWELAFMGLPAILLRAAENQRAIARQMDDIGAALEFEVERIAQGAELRSILGALAQDAGRRRGMSQIGRRLVDGQGVARVVRLLAGGEQAQLALRPAKAGDALLIWQWANHPAVRANSFSQETIPFASHLAWFDERLQSENVRIYLLELGSLPVGQVRYEREGDDQALISIVIAPGSQGRGLGTAILELSIPPACAALGVQRLRAVAFASNQGSMRVFEKAGFAAIEEKLIEGRQCVILERICEKAGQEHG